MSTKSCTYWTVAVGLIFMVSQTLGQTEQPVRGAAPNRLAGGALGLGLGSGLAPGAITPTITQAPRRTAPGIVLQGVRRRVPQEYATIQGAIDASSDGDTVLASEGTYPENIRYKGKAIVVGSLYLIDGDTTHIERTIISGSPFAHADSGSIVCFVDGEDTTSVLCGLTITGGTGTLLDRPFNALRARIGGGIYCQSSDARISRCIVTRNKVTAPLLGPSNRGAHGGGICAFNSSLTPHTVVLESNVITDNVAYGSGNSQWLWGGGAALIGVSGRIVGNIFERDSVISSFGGVGGGLSISFADFGYPLPKAYVARNVIRSNVVTVASQGAVGVGLSLIQTDESTISDNLVESNTGTSVNGWAQGGGLLLDDQHEAQYGRKMIARNRFLNNRLRFGGADPQSGGGLLLFRTLATVDGNEIAGNIADQGGGGIAAYGSSFRIQNNIITGNSSQQVGGGLDIRMPPQTGSEQLVVNNTVYANSSTVGGGLSAADGANVVSFNNIFWNNSATSQGAEIHGSLARVAYSDVKGGYGGTGNIDADPLFVPADTMFRLTPTSPCISMGIDSLQAGGSWHRAPTFDCDRMDRPMPAGTLRDMGAREEQTAAPAFAESAAIDQPFARPGVDSVCVMGSLVNPLHHAVALSAIVADSAVAVRDSARMFDDGGHGDGNPGDNIWGCFVRAPLSEDFYGVAIRTNDNTQGTVRQLPDAARFTTAGPLTLDSVAVMKRTASYTLKPYLRNNGTSFTVRGARVRLTCIDPWVKTISTNLLSLPDLAPGEVKGTNEVIGVAVDTTFPGYWNLKAMASVDGRVYWVDSASADAPVMHADDIKTLPTAFALEQNYPNPFNPKTVIRCQWPVACDVRLVVYDVVGREAAVLLNGRRAPGRYEIEFDASALASGVYFYRLQAGEFVSMKPLVVLR